MDNEIDYKNQKGILAPEDMEINIQILGCGSTGSFTGPEQVG